MDMNELKSMLRDSAREAIANEMVLAAEKAKEQVDRAMAEHRDLLSEFKRQLQTEQRSVISDKDPRGLLFARCLKASTVAQGQRVAPAEVASRWAKETGGQHYREVAEQLDASAKRAASEGTFTAGGALVPGPALGEFIDLTYARTLALEMGANRIDINRSLDMSKMTAGATAYYVEEGANITPSQPTFGRLSLISKKAAAVVPITNELLNNPSVGADTIIRNNLVRTMALRRDLSFFRGAGNLGQPKGMLNWTAAGNTDTQGGTTVADKVADTIQMVRMVDEANAGLERCGYVMAPRTKWALAATYDSGVGLVFLTMLMAGNLWGFPVGTTTAIPKNLGGGGNESEIHFGNFGETVLSFDSTIGTEIELFPNGTFHDGSALVSGISADMSVIRIKEAHDALLLRDTAWSTLTAVTWA